jgi:hypothetical protein
MYVFRIFGLFFIVFLFGIPSMTIEVDTAVQNTWG